MKFQKLVYRVRPAIRTEAQRQVLLDSWSNFATLATDLRGRVGTPLARYYAARARSLITTFGARWDEKPMGNRAERAS